MKREGEGPQMKREEEEFDPQMDADGEAVIVPHRRPSASSADEEEEKEFDPQMTQMDADREGEGVDRGDEEK
jgi:hypothetical protein